MTESSLFPSNVWAVLGAIWAPLENWYPLPGMPDPTGPYKGKQVTNHALPNMVGKLKRYYTGKRFLFYYLASFCIQIKVACFERHSVWLARPCTEDASPDKTF